MPERKHHPKNDRMTVTIDTVVSPDGVTTMQIDTFLRDAGGLKKRSFDVVDLAAFQAIATAEDAILDIVEKMALAEHAEDLGGETATPVPKPGANTMEHGDLPEAERDPYWPLTVDPDEWGK